MSEVRSVLSVMEKWRSDTSGELLEQSTWDCLSQRILVFGARMNLKTLTLMSARNVAILNSIRK